MMCFSFHYPCTQNLAQVAVALDILQSINFVCNRLCPVVPCILIFFLSLWTQISMSLISESVDPLHSNQGQCFRTQTIVIQEIDPHTFFVLSQRQGLHRNSRETSQWLLWKFPSPWRVSKNYSWSPFSSWSFSVDKMSLAFVCAPIAHWAFDAIDSKNILANLLSKAIPMKAPIADDSMIRTWSLEKREATNQKHNHAKIAIGTKII